MRVALAKTFYVGLNILFATKVLYSGVFISIRIVPFCARHVESCLEKYCVALCSARRNQFIASYKEGEHFGLTCYTEDLCKDVC